MKTSTKIFIGYGAAIVAIQVVFLANTLYERHTLKPVAEAFCRQLDATEIHVAYINYTSNAPGIILDGYCTVARPNTGDKIFANIGNNLRETHIGHDTLYIKGHINFSRNNLDQGIFLRLPHLKTSVFSYGDKELNKTEY